MSLNGSLSWPSKSHLLRKLLRRDSSESGPITLDRRRIYILPTRSGFVFALMLLAMLLGAVNYQNSLAFVLTFLLTGLALVSMFHTFRNLHGLTLRAGHPTPVFAGEPARFNIHIQNRIGSHRFTLNLKLKKQSPVTLDLTPFDGQWLVLTLPSHKRGLLNPGRITVSTRFPLGLFYAWSYIHLSMPCVIYPLPANQRGLPPELLDRQGETGDQGRGNDDFAALRAYQPGDSLRHIHWKSAAREQGLHTKQFGGALADALWLRWEQTGHLSTEERISLLTRWVIEADTLGLTYGLALPDSEIAPSQGDAHRHRCLKALALYGVPHPPL